MCTGFQQRDARTLPDGFSQEDIQSFLAIGLRAASEAVNCYTVLSLGAQAYLTNRCVAECAYQRPLDTQ
jgi:hypothetical protein